MPFSKISRSLSSVEREQRSVKPGKILKISYCDGDVDDDIIICEGYAEILKMLTIELVLNHIPAGL